MLPAASRILNSRARGFAPIAAPDARVLILGSLPSQLSLQKQEYFGNPQNVFWRVMGELYDAGPDIPYADRAARLMHCGIAVWDVLHSSVRPGSMDAAIVGSTATPNDFQTFFDEHQYLQLICFNGLKAAHLFKRLVVAKGIGNIDRLEYRTMPSTSPAFAAMRYEEKTRRWSAIRQAATTNRRP